MSNALLAISCFLATFVFGGLAIISGTLSFLGFWVASDPFDVAVGLMGFVFFVGCCAALLDFFKSKLEQVAK